MNYTQCAQQHLDTFASIRGWEGKYRQLMQLGKKLAPLAQEHKQDHNLVKGCESNVWLQVSKNDNGQYRFAVDSNARIVKGLLVIVIAAYNQLTAQQIAQVDIDSYIGQLDLTKHLSPSRNNGIHAIIEQIQQYGR